MFQLNEIQLNDATTVTNQRHMELIRIAKNNAIKAQETIKAQMPIDIVSINIKEIIESLNSITGENATEDLIKDIFSKFCLGK